MLLVESVQYQPERGSQKQLSFPVHVERTNVHVHEDVDGRQQPRKGESYRHTRLGLQGPNGLVPQEDAGQVYTAVGPGDVDIKGGNADPCRSWQSLPRQPLRP